VTIGISGASGKLGRLAVEAALERVSPDELVITTRTPDAVDDFVRRGIEVRHADFDAPATLPPAFAGIDRLFIISASNGTGKREDQHGEAIRVAREAGVERLVFPSMPKVDDASHPVGLAAEEYRIAEQQVIDSGVPWIILRDAPYSELHVIERFTPALAQGRMVINTADGQAGFVSRRDVARAAIAALLNDDAAVGIYDVSGPELLSFRDVAALLSDVSGRTLEYVDVDDERFREQIRAAGVPALMVDALTGMGRAVREGYFAVQTDAVEQLTGQPPQTLRAVLEDHRAELQAAAAAGT
jgi:NAD(P)H dehydrogenase (quinone)